MKMKNLFSIIMSLSFAFVSNAIFAQTGSVGIGTTTPDSNAVLDVHSETKGLLLPRLSLTDTASPAPLTAHVAGIVVYNTASTGNVSPGFFYNDGSKWVRISGTVNVPNAWLIQGNTGTNPDSNYVGTQDNAGLAFRVNNTHAGYLGTELNGNASFGFNSLKLSYKLNNKNTAIGIGALENLIGDGIYGEENVAIGSGAMQATQGGSWNTAIGIGALGGMTGSTSGGLTGRNNTAIGNNALGSISTGAFNIAVGASALHKVNGTAQVTGSSNIVIGSLSRYEDLTTGSANILLGNGLLGKLSTGSNNIFLGGASGHNTTTGSDNIAIGRSANVIDPVGNGQLNIGNVIWGSGLAATATASNTKKIGINTTAVPNSTLQVNGSVSAKVRAISSGTVAVDDYTILMQGNISLPAADATNTGRIYVIVRDVATTPLTISGTFRFAGANQTNYVFGSGTFLNGITVQSNGSAWVILSGY